MPENAVIPYQAEISEAQASGDDDRAQELYRLQQGVEVDERGRVTLTEPAEASVPSVPSMPVEQADGMMATLARHDPDGAESLRAAWGTDIASNLAHATMVASRYLPSGMLDMAPDADLLRLGATLGRGIRADLRDAIPLTAEPTDEPTTARFLGVLAEEDPDGTPTLQAMPGDQVRAGLGAVKALMARYHVDAATIPDNAGFWRAAIEAAPKIIADLQSRAGRSTTTTTENTIMDEGGGEEAFADKLDELRAQQQELMARGEHRRANALFQREMELLAARHGDQPIVGAGRYA